METAEARNVFFAATVAGLIFWGWIAALVLHLLTISSPLETWWAIPALATGAVLYVVLAIVTGVIISAVLMNDELPPSASYYD